MNRGPEPMSPPMAFGVGTTSGAPVLTSTRRSTHDERLALLTTYGTSGFSTIAPNAGPGFLLFIPGTSAGSFRRSEPPFVQLAITQIRQRSGLTWEQLARVFGVKRRSLHFWARGTRPSAENTERLLRVLAIVSQLDTGEPEHTRTELLRPRRGDVSAYDALCAGRDYAVVGLVRESRRDATKRSRRPPALDSAARDRRRGYSPTELLDALHEGGPPLGRTLGMIPVPRDEA